GPVPARGPRQHPQARRSWLAEPPRSLPSKRSRVLLRRRDLSVEFFAPTSQLVGHKAQGEKCWPIVASDRIPSKRPALQQAFSFARKKHHEDRLAFEVHPFHRV